MERGLQPTDSLALAVIYSSSSPLLMLDADLRVVAASASFCNAFDLKHAEADGCMMSKLGKGEWGAPQLEILLASTVDATAFLQTYEMDLVRPGQATRRVLIQPRMLDHGYARNDRLLVGVTDVTDERHNTKMNSMLLAEKAVLLQELQHRVANSLQIIASILLISARRVQSPETRLHLQDAHGRVMSFAAVQEQLSASSGADVDVRSYLERLCQSLGASMIHDHMKISIAVVADAGRLTPQASVSVGLIVTELVINCLKHAFPAGEGVITVTFNFLGRRWELSVMDDGIGMPTDPLEAKAGLGTSLVEALATQLGASISIANGFPGTIVSIMQTAAADPVEAQRAL